MEWSSEGRSGSRPEVVERNAEAVGEEKRREVGKNTRAFGRGKFLGIRGAVMLSGVITLHLDYAERLEKKIL